MKAAPRKLLRGSGVQGLLLAAALFVIGTPAGFSICGISWKFPWLDEIDAALRGAPVSLRGAPASLRPGAASFGETQPVVAQKPALPASTVMIACIWRAPASAVFCVTVRNDLDRSIRIGAGQLNLSAVGMANADWPAETLPAWEAVRLPTAKVQILADRELPGAPRRFALDLTVPPGHARRFLLQVDAANMPVQQPQRFYAVGSLVLEDGQTERVSPEFNVFGRSMQEN